MSSKLEESTTQAKKLSVGCIILVVVISIGSLLWKLLKPGEIPPDIYPSTPLSEFGDLKELELESLSLAEGSEPKYTLDISKIPYKYLKVLSVYKTSPPRQSLTAHEDAVNVAKSLGFSSNPLLVSESLLKWIEEPRTLEIDKFNWTIRLTSDYLSNEILSQEHNYLSDTKSYISSASGAVGGTGFRVFPTTKASFMRIEKDGSLVLSQSPQEADLVRVDFFDEKEAIPVYVPSNADKETQEKIAKYRIYSDVLPINPNFGLVYAIVSDIGYVYELQVYNWETIDSSTYAIVNPQTAWEEVEKGNGKLVSLTKTEADKFKPYTPLEVKEFLIKEISIGYYNTSEYSPFIQPIFVFTGRAILSDLVTEADFMIFYPAVDYDWEPSTEGTN